MKTPVMRNNKRKYGRKLFKNIAIGAFDQLAKLPFVQNKWISSNVWYELALQRHNIDSEIDASYFRRLLLASDSKISNDISVSNEHGYYSQTNKLWIGGRRQLVHAILVTEPGTLPRLSQAVSWHAQVIMCMPPSWRTHSNCITPPPPAAPAQQRRRVSAAVPIATVPIATVPDVATVPNVAAAVPNVLSPATPATFSPTIGNLLKQRSFLDI